MKILLDACVWGGAEEYLRRAGHDVVHAGTWPTDPGDREILAQAHREGRVLVTLDKDFGELAIVQGVPHCGIVRLVGVSAVEQGKLALVVFAQVGQELSSGAIVTATRSRLRIRSSSEPASRERHRD